MKSILGEIKTEALEEHLDAKAERPRVWRCEGCGRTLHPSDLTRVGIGVHHYDRDKDREGSGLLNCGLVRQV